MTGVFPTSSVYVRLKRVPSQKSFGIGLLNDILSNYYYWQISNLIHKLYGTQTSNKCTMLVKQAYLKALFHVQATKYLAQDIAQ